MADEKNKKTDVVAELEAKLQEKEAVINALSGLVKYWSGKVVDNESNVFLAKLQQEAQQNVPTEEVEE
jgi:hypothetical protein|tara:strand:+ start:206 stop:409 length:204 start_codon:yes stop_codon:yes gene_type:complete